VNGENIIVMGHVVQAWKMSVKVFAINYIP